MTELDQRICRLGRCGSDIGVRNNRISGKHRNTFISGLFPTAKATTESLPFHNLLERDFLLICEADPEVIELVANQEAVRWVWQDREFETIVPFLWRGRTRRSHYVSVIHSKHVSSHKLQEFVLPLSAAIEAGLGGRYQIVTEDEIRLPGVLTDAAHLVFSRMPGQDLGMDWLRLCQVLRAEGAMTIARLQATAHLGVDGFRIIVRLIAEGRLRRVNPKAPLQSSMKVTLP